ALTNESGLALLTQVTGSGCLLGSIIAATLGAVCQDRSVNEMELVQLATASLDAVRFYGQAAERAAAHAALKGPLALRFILLMSSVGREPNEASKTVSTKIFCHGESRLPP